MNILHIYSGSQATILYVYITLESAFSGLQGGLNFY